MDSKTSQVAVAGLVIAVIALVAGLSAAGVAVYTYVYDHKKHPSAETTAYMARAFPAFAPRPPPPPPPAHMQQAPLTQSFSELPPQPNLAAVPRVEMLSGAASAPPIPKSIRSGTVGSFFDDELPQA